MQGDGTQCCTLRNVACFVGCLACNLAFSALSSVAATQDHCFGVGLFLEDGCGSGNVAVGTWRWELGTGGYLTGWGC